MITYDPKDWFTLIFQFHKSDTFRRLLPTMLLIGAVTAVACYLEKKYIHYPIPSLTVFHQISGFIISLVLVFRINTAYDRWYEGRKLWGSLVNNSRNLALRLHLLIPANDKGLRNLAQQLIASFPHALKVHLRATQGAYNDILFNSEMTAEGFEKAQHKPAFIASRLNHLCLRISLEHGKSHNDHLILSENLGSLIDIAGACERIRSTPIPYSYSIFIKKVIFLYIITMPFTFGMTIGYWSVPIVMIMFYAFASLELISEEIEDPFGTDANDLPTDDIANRIQKNVEEILLSSS